MELFGRDNVMVLFLMRSGVKDDGEEIIKICEKENICKLKVIQWDRLMLSFKYICFVYCFCFNFDWQYQ